jgi:predicted glutamine amidotransferase
MCELLALNANTPTDMGFSFRGLSRRGGASGEHADGWGLASFTPDGHPHRPSLTLLREEAPAALSALAGGPTGGAFPQGHGQHRPHPQGHPRSSGA